jgi:hypothetical protein
MEETMDWIYEGQSYADEHVLAKAILGRPQAALLQLQPLAFRLTWKETDLPARDDCEDWNYIYRIRTIKLEPSVGEASALEVERARAIVEGLGVVEAEHEVAYANLKPSSGELVNQAQCEQHLGDLLESVHKRVHELEQAS